MATYKGGIVDYNIGDPVMHWTYGFGKIVKMEERVLSGKKKLYYAVRSRNLTVWVPADEKISKRLRPPTSPRGFKKLFKILTGSGEPLEENSRQRKMQLVEQLKDGRAESMCRVIRDLVAQEKIKSLNATDQNLLKRVQKVLLGEWEFSLSVPPGQAASDLHRMLDNGSTAGD
jgi:RNA polymerase-interacting CarD/CdnL/TRCF family regulator